MAGPIQRVAILVIILSVLAAAFSLLRPLPPQLAGAQADTNSAAVVVQFGNGNVITRRVTFDTPTITGIEALKRTGLQLTTVDSSFGEAVCAIEDTGCPATNCFCAANFWSYWQVQNAAWVASPVGASSATVRPGAVEGWAWDAFPAAPPAILPATLTPELQVTLDALGWLRTQQLPDGGYPGSGRNTVGATVDALWAVAAANGNPATWRHPSGNGLIDALRNGATEFAARNAASAGKLVLGVAAADLDPRAFGGLNLLDTLRTYYDPATSSFGGNNWDQALGMLAWHTAGETIPVTATRLLIARQNEDGGWSYVPTVGNSTIDTTALVLQALAVRNDDPAYPDAALRAASAAGLAFLRAQQNADGGFPADPPGPSNANSTGFAVQAILAAGQDPLSAAWTKPGNATPLSFLRSLRTAEGGLAFRDAATPPSILATNQAIPALVGKAFPLPSKAVAVRKALAWIADQQQPDGSFAGFGVGATVDAILAIVAAGGDPAAFVSPAGNTPLAYLATQAAAYAATSPAATGKLAVGVAAAGGDVTRFGGTHLTISMTNHFSPTLGRFAGPSSWDQAWSVLGLAATGNATSTAVLSTTDYLKRIQTPSGGWPFAPPSQDADGDTTGLVLQALAAAGVPATDPAIVRALAYLRTLQNADGGFPGFDGSTSASSTGLVLQGLAAVGENADSLAWTTTITDGAASRLTLHNPVDALLALQSPQGGLAGFAGPNDPFSTYQGVPGLVGQALPLRPPVAVQAAFTATPLTGTAPLTVTFTNTATGDYTFSAWDFGNGQTSGLRNPTHTYTTSGVYTVTLTVSGAGGSASLVRTSYLTVTADAASSAIEVSPTQGGTLAYTDPRGTSIVLAVPAGAVTQTTRIVASPALTPTTTPTPSLTFAGTAFSLDAFQAGQRRERLFFVAPGVTITLNYRPETLAGLDAATLRLYYQAGATWIDAAQTCPPPAAYDRSQPNQLRVRICHLSQFATFAATDRDPGGPAVVYLPLVSR